MGGRGYNLTYKRLKSMLDETHSTKQYFVRHHEWVARNGHGVEDADVFGGRERRLVWSEVWLSSLQCG